MSGASSLVIYRFYILEYQNAPRAAKRKAKKKAIKIKLRVHSYYVNWLGSIAYFDFRFKRGDLIVKFTPFYVPLVYHLFQNEIPLILSKMV